MIGRKTKGSIHRGRTFGAVPAMMVSFLLLSSLLFFRVTPLYPETGHDSGQCGYRTILSPLPAGGNALTLLKQKGYTRLESGETLLVKLIHHPGRRLSHEVIVRFGTEPTTARGRGYSFESALVNAVQRLPSCSD